MRSLRRGLHWCGKCLELLLCPVVFLGAAFVIIPLSLGYEVAHSAWWQRISVCWRGLGKEA